MSFDDYVNKMTSKMHLDSKEHKTVCNGALCRHYLNSCHSFFLYLTGGKWQ